MNVNKPMNASVELIRSKLAALEKGENVRIILAVESGSRAWGFPSADSDFDVRFIYVHPPDWYLSIDEGRDVIERPIDSDDLDLSGWDLKKALRLFRKSNPPLLEWLQSPIVYLENHSVAAQLRGLMPSSYSPRACMHHYLHMAEGNFREYLQGESVRVKKYFYVLRPVLACLWIEAGYGIAPMEFSRLVERVLPTGPVRDEVESLLKKKVSGEELDRGPRIDILNQYLAGELARLGQGMVSEEGVPYNTEGLNKLFRDALLEIWPT